MRKDQGAFIWGIVLVLVGLLFLFQSLGFLDNVGDIVWALGFGVAGAVFCGAFLNNRAQWWAVIPGFTLLGLAILMGTAALHSGLEDLVGVPLFLGAIGASFWVIYATQRRFWWAIIPGGVMFSVALLVFLEALPLPFDVAWVIMLGIAATFGAVSMVRTENGKRLSWALIPAGILGIIGLMLMVEAVALLRYVWPVALIAGGVVFLLRYARRNQPME